MYFILEQIYIHDKHFRVFLDILDSMTNISVIFMVSLVRRVFHLLHGFFGQLNGLAEFGRLGF